MDQDKIIVVAYPLGRVGSSAMMGLLQVAGVHVGNDRSLAGPALMNPKGFFELKSQHAFLCQAFPSAYPSTVNPPSLETLAAGAQEHARAYLDLLLAEIGQFPMAVKAQRMLTVPLLYECREQYDVRVLLMTRDLEDQVNSTLRVWARSDSQEQRSATPEFVRAWIEAWLDYGDQVRAAYDLPYYQVAFERLIADPVGTMQDVSRFLDIPCPPAAAIEGWINKDLVNRPTFSLAHLKDLLRHRVFKR